MHAAKYIYVFGCYTNLATPPHHTPIQTWLRQDLDDGLGSSLTTPVLPLGARAKGLPPKPPERPRACRRGVEGLPPRRRLIKYCTFVSREKAVAVERKLKTAAVEDFKQIILASNLAAASLDRSRRSQSIARLKLISDSKN